VALLLLTLASAALLAPLPGCAGREAPQPAHPLVGQRFGFSLPDRQGQKVGPDQYAGRVVLVDLWATWCKPCALSLPIYAKIERELGPAGLTVLGVSIDEDDEILQAYLDEHPLPFPILRDPNQSLPARINAEAMPTLVLIGRSGLVAYVHSSFRQGDEQVVEAEVRRALAAR
jgi:peroxiredoxin